MENCKSITECLACGSQDLIKTLDLGEQPLANNFKSDPAQPEPIFPLAINRCGHCNHLQLTHAVDPAIIYTHYLYVSGTSQTNRDYMQWFAGFVSEQFNGRAKSVLDIGCNDGTQLDYLKQAGLDTYGVDPAENIWPTSSANHRVVCGFWDEASAAQLGPDQFCAIIAQNSFAHNPDPLPWLVLAKKYLKDQGKIFIQTSQADMVINGEFDTIYHEHVNFYNAYSMKCLAERAGLHLIDVVKTPIHGNSYIFVLGKEPKNTFGVQNALAMEQSLGLQTAGTYQAWATGVHALLDQIKDQLAEFKGFGYHIVGYGAAAKGMTLLNASHIHLDAVIDDNPLKQNHWCPGTDIPVVSSNYIAQLPADDIVVFVPLAWNFYTEIVGKIRSIRASNKDMFVRYFPTITTDFYDN